MSSSHVHDGRRTRASYAVVPSPIGDLLLAAEETADGAALTRLEMTPWRDAPATSAIVPDSDGVLALAREQLDEYFAGQRVAFDLPLAMKGSPFQQRVWQTLTTIGYGETWSYGRLATVVADVRAARAVGAANGQNPISIVVPCHRVIGANGRLVGYGGGLDRKRYLLGLEARVSVERAFSAG